MMTIPKITVKTPEGVEVECLVRDAGKPCGICGGPAVAFTLPDNEQPIDQFCSRCRVPGFPDSVGKVPGFPYMDDYK